MESRKLIDVVDDDENVQMVVDRHLICDGFTVKVFSAAEGALLATER